jgi:antitoxin CcdA
MERFAMGYDTTAPKRAINMTINADLVRRARMMTPNLSETVEGLLSEFVAAEERKRDDIAAQIRQWCEASDATVARYGYPGDDDLPFG